MIGAVLLWCAIGGLFLVSLATLLWCLHRLCLRLEEAGYLYYRERGGGGASGLFSEIDRLTRPSIQHVVEVNDETVHQEERIGGE